MNQYVKLAVAVKDLVGLLDETTKVTVYVPLMDWPVSTQPFQVVVLPVSHRFPSGVRPVKTMPTGEIVTLTESPAFQPVTLTVNVTRGKVAL